MKRNYKLVHVILKKKWSYKKFRQLQILLPKHDSQAPEIQCGFAFA